MEGAEKVRVQWLINKPAAPNFAMRRFIVREGGCTPLHTHDYEHEVYVLEGRGVVTDGKEGRLLEHNSVAFIPANHVHQFKNIGSSDFIFLCIIPV